jgi:hypothetical protein
MQLECVFQSNGVGTIGTCEYCLGGQRKEYILNEAGLAIPITGRARRKKDSSTMKTQTPHMQLASRVWFSSLFWSSCQFYVHEGSVRKDALHSTTQINMLLYDDIANQQYRVFLVP